MHRRVAATFAGMALFAVGLVVVPGDLYLSSSADPRRSGNVLVLLLGCSVFVVASGLLGYVVAGRLVRPLAGLAVGARGLGTGRFDVDVPHSGIPEVEEIGSALRDSGERLEALVRRDREFAVNASHLLRTPITALRLDLEDLALWPQTPADIAAELRRSLAELDRLSATITGVVDASRSSLRDAATVLHLSDLVRARVQRAQPEAHAAGHELCCPGQGAVTARLPAQPVAEVLDTLLSRVLADAPAHSPIVVETRDHTTHLSVRIGIRGEATGRDRGGSPQTWLGADLEQTKAAVAALDGHLSVDSRPKSGVTLRLPNHLADTPTG